MDIVKIQALIAQGRVVKVTDIDPANSFVQIGVYQPDNRKIGSANNTYPPFVIPLSELGGGGGVWGTITGLLANQLDLQAALDAKEDSLGFVPYDETNPDGFIDATALVPYQLALGFTPEDVANKDIDGTLAANSNILYPSQRAVKTYVDASVSGVLDDRGNWDASGNVFPSTGGSGPLGTILKGDLWFVSVPGTLGGNPVLIGSNFRALIDNPLLSTDWNILNSGVGYIPENIANKGIPNGYAELDVTGKVPLAQLPSFSIIVKLTKALNGPVVTGTTTQTILDSLLIPANTFKVGMAKINIRNVWTTSAVTKASRIYINTTNSLVGATLIGLATSGSGARSVDMGRILAIKSLSSFEVYGLGTMVAAESQLSTNVVDITYDATVNNYIIVSIVQGVADSCLNSYINFEI